MNICVFCASSDNLPKEYYDIGYALGRLIAQGGHTLVFGGYTKGIMGAVAKGAQENDGHIISVIPEIFNRGTLNFKDNADVIITDSLSSRKDKLIELADAFIALPGGIGTFDELFQVMALKSAGEINKPIAIVMQGPTQKALHNMITQAVSDQFIPAEGLKLVDFCDNADDAIRSIFK